MTPNLNPSGRLLLVLTADAACGTLVYSAVGDLWFLPSLLASCNVFYVLLVFVLVLLTTTLCLFRLRELTKACLDVCPSHAPNNKATGRLDPKGPRGKHPDRFGPQRPGWRDPEAPSGAIGDPNSAGFISQWLSRAVRDADALLKTSLAANLTLCSLAMTVCLHRHTPQDLNSAEEDCWYSDSNYDAATSSISQVMLLQLLLTTAPTLALVALEVCLRREAKKGPQGQQRGPRTPRTQGEGSPSCPRNTDPVHSLGSSGGGALPLPLGRCCGPVGDVVWLSLLVGVHLAWSLCGCGLLALYWRAVVMSGVLTALRLLLLPLLALKVLGTGAG